MNIETQLLHQETLTGMIRDFKGSGANLKRFFPKGQTIKGRSHNWDIVRVIRTLGNVVGHDSPATVQKHETIAKGKATLARSFESMRIQGSTLLNLRNPGSMDFQNIAKDQIGRDVKTLAGIMDRLDDYMAINALQGTLTLTVDGVADTVSYHFSNDHILTVGGNELANDVLTTGWDDPDADIVRDVGAMIQKVLEDSGYTPETAIITPEVEQSLLKNDQFVNIMRSTPKGVAAYNEGKIGHLLGLDWVTVGDAYKASNGDVTRFLGAGKVVLVPPPDADVLSWVTGTDTIPTADLQNIQEVAGRYSYSAADINPAAVKLFAGDMRFPEIKIPDALLTATVV